MNSVFVDGVPAGQGNLRRSPKGGGLYESSHHTRPWRYAIAAEVRGAIGTDPPTGLPVSLIATFSFPRPVSHVLKSGKLAKHAPRSKTGNPDIDKLCRAVLDALTGVLYLDDAQVVRMAAAKVYGPRAGLDLSWHFDTSEADE